MALSNRDLASAIGMSTMSTSLHSPHYGTLVTPPVVEAPGGKRTVWAAVASLVLMLTAGAAVHRAGSHSMTTGAHQVCGWSRLRCCARMRASVTAAVVVGNAVFFRDGVCEEVPRRK